MLSVPLQPLAAYLFENRPTHVFGQSRGYLCSVYRGRVRELQGAGQRSNEAIPEGQKRIGNTIESSALRAFAERKLTPNPS